MASSRPAAELLKLLLPFMIVKRRRAELAIKLYFEGSWWDRKTDGLDYRRPVGELERREKIFEEFRSTIPTNYEM